MSIEHQIWKGASTNHSGVERRRARCQASRVDGHQLSTITRHDEITQDLLGILVDHGATAPEGTSQDKEHRVELQEERVEEAKADEHR